MQRVSLPKPVLILCLAVALVSLFFRFSNLETKVFWHDEAYTAVPVSGYQRSKIRDDIYNRTVLNQPFTAENFQIYQHPQPGTTLGNTIDAVAVEEPQNSPLYFILARLWLQATNLPPILGLRLLSVLIGLLLFPGVYVLCQQLFKARAIAWVGVGLFLTSPLHLIYAQEARQYSLLTVITVWASVLLLQAIQTQRVKHWVFYSVLCILGFYTQPFFAFVAAAHGVYVVLGDRLKPSRIVSYLMATGMSVLAFLPWLHVIMNDLGAISDWRGVNTLPLPGLIGRWLINLCHTFVDFYVGDRHNYDLQVELTNPYLYLSLGILALVVMAYVRLIRSTPRSVWVFVVSLSVVPALALVLPDLWQGGIRSTIPRYILPSFMGVQLAVAYGVGDRISSPLLPHRTQQIWRFMLAILLTLGILSGVQMSQAQTWWSKYSNYYDPEVATIIHAAPKAAVLSDNTIRLLSISYQLPPDTVYLTTRKEAPLALVETPNLFIFDMDGYTPALRSQLRQQYGLDTELIYSRPIGFTKGEIQLWKAVK